MRAYSLSLGHVVGGRDEGGLLEGRGMGVGLGPHGSTAP